MNIKFSIKKNKKINMLCVRVYFKKLDISSKIPLFIYSEKDWDDLNECFKNDNESNETILKLKLNILKAFNKDFSVGTIIDSNWLKNIINETFNRPCEEVSMVNLDRNIYFYDFAKYWIENYSSTWKTDHKNTMSKVLISQYKKFAELFKNFEIHSQKRYLLSDISVDDVYSFVNYMEYCSYNNSTIDRHVGRLKFIINRATDLSLKVSKISGQRIYIEKEDENIEGVFLNEEEIFKIHTNTKWESNLFTADDLENAKDNLVLSCFTSLRISDFMGGLDTSKIKNNVIQIRTKKTGAFVRIPLHPFVKEILNKRFGNLPRKSTHYQYNIMVKEICMICRIDKIILGKLWNPELKRKELVYSPKFNFITSHSARRSFVSNMRGKISDDALRSFGGWTTNKIMYTYDQTSNDKYVKELENFWENQK